MTIKCILHTQTGLCVNIIDDPTDTYTAPDGYSVAPDNTGQIFWYWDGDNWYNPTDKYFNAYLGSPVANSPDVSSEDDTVATTFYVRQKIEDYIENVWLPTAILNGGTFTDTAIVADYVSENFNSTNSNLNSDLNSPDFSNSGGNLSGDIDGGTF